MKKAMFLTMAALTVAALSTGCIGKFRLTHKVLDWNKTVHEEEWVQEVIFLAGHIVPAYPLSIFADLIVFNSIEWWTKKPVEFLAGVDQNGNEYQIVTNGDGSATLLYKGQACTLTKQGNGGVAMTKDGTYVGSFAKHGDLVTFTAADGTVQGMLR